MTKNTDKFSPENLQKMEQEARAVIDSGSIAGGHCGAYYAYRTGIDMELIKSHGVIDDDYALDYARNVNALLKAMGLSCDGEILDAGCGIGTITNAFSKTNSGGRTFGLDLSTDAIEMARERYSTCTFTAQSADELDNFEDSFFDVIHTREFYPFTRSNDCDFHLRFFKAFYVKLKPGRIVLVSTITVPKGLCNTFRHLSWPLKEMGYSLAKKKVIVPLRLTRRAGTWPNEFPFYWLITLLGVLLDIVRPGRVNFMFVVRKADHGA